LCRHWYFRAGVVGAGGAISQLCAFPKLAQRARFAIAALAILLTSATSAAAEIPMLGNRQSTEYVLRAIRAAERSDGADFTKRVAVAPAGVLDGEPVTMAALDRRDEGCELAGLDGWSASEVAALWHCRGAEDIYLFTLARGKLVRFVRLGGSHWKAA
jgi:hypothetical protein